MRKMLFSGALLILAAGQAQADYQCRVNPQDDIVISPQQVKVVGPAATCRFHLQVTCCVTATR